MKSDSTLHDCLCIAKLTKCTVHVEKLGQNFLANVEKHDQNVDAVNQNSDSRAIARAKEAPRVIKEEKVVRNHVVTVEPTTHLISVQHMEKTVFSTRKKDILVPAGTTNSVVVHPQEDLDIIMKWNKMTMVIIGHFP